MDRINPVFLDLVGDISGVALLAKELGRSLSVCSCVQGMKGRIVDYAQIYINRNGALTTSLEGLISSGDSIAAEVGLRMGLNFNNEMAFEAPDVIFGKTHSVLVSGCVVGFDLADTFLGPYSKTYEVLTGGSLSLVPFNLLDVRVVAIGLGVLQQSEKSLLGACKKMGFAGFAGERAWSKSLLTLFLLNRLVEYFGVEQVLKFGVGNAFVSTRSSPSSSHSESEYKLSSATPGRQEAPCPSRMSAEPLLCTVGLECSAESSSLSSGTHDQLSVQEESGEYFESKEDARSNPEVDKVEIAAKGFGPMDSPLQVEEILDRPRDLQSYAIGLVDTKRVRSKMSDGVVRQIEECLAEDHFDAEKCLYDVQNIILSGIRDGSVNPMSLVTQSKVECVRKTVGHKKNLMLKAISLALKKNGVFLDQIEIAACLKLAEENIE